VAQLGVVSVKRGQEKSLQWSWSAVASDNPNKILGIAPSAAAPSSGDGATGGKGGKGSQQNGYTFGLGRQQNDALALEAQHHLRLKKDFSGSTKGGKVNSSGSDGGGGGRGSSGGGGVILHPGSHWCNIILDVANIAKVDGGIWSWDNMKAVIDFYHSKYLGIFLTCVMPPQRGNGGHRSERWPPWFKALAGNQPHRGLGVVDTPSDIREHDNDDRFMIAKWRSDPTAQLVTRDNFRDWTSASSSRRRVDEETRRFVEDASKSRKVMFAIEQTRQGPNFMPDRYPFPIEEKQHRVGHLAQSPFALAGLGREYREVSLESKVGNADTTGLGDTTTMPAAPDAAKGAAELGGATGIRYRFASDPTAPIVTLGVPGMADLTVGQLSLLVGRHIRTGHIDGEEKGGDQDDNPVIVANNCPGEHGLETFEASTTVGIPTKCDGCDKIVGGGAVMKGCRACNFELCEACAEGGGKNSPFAVLYHAEGYPLARTRDGLNASLVEEHVGSGDLIFVVEDASPSHSFWGVQIGGGFGAVFEMSSFNAPWRVDHTDAPAVASLCAGAGKIRSTDWPTLVQPKPPKELRERFVYGDELVGKNVRIRFCSEDDPGDLSWVSGLVKEWCASSGEHIIQMGDNYDEESFIMGDLDFEMFELEAPLPRSSPVTACPEKHPLSPFNSRYPAPCDCCGSDMAVGAQRFGCTDCDYDICKSCKKGGARLDGGVNGVAGEINGKWVSSEACRENGRLSSIVEEYYSDDSEDDSHEGDTVLEDELGFSMDEHKIPAFAPKLADFCAALRVAVEGDLAPMAREKHRLLGRLSELTRSPPLVLAMTLLFERLPLTAPSLLALKDGLWHLGRTLLDPSEVPDDADILGSYWPQLWSYLAQTSTARHEELGKYTRKEWICDTTGEPITEPAVVDIDADPRTAKVYDLVESQRKQDETALGVILPNGEYLATEGQGSVIDFLDPSPKHKRWLRMCLGTTRVPFLHLNEATLQASTSSTIAATTAGRKARPMLLAALALHPSMRINMPLTMKEHLATNRALLVRYLGNRMLVYMGASGAAVPESAGSSVKGGGDASRISLFDPMLPLGGPVHANIDQLSKDVAAERRTLRKAGLLDEPTRPPEEAIIVAIDVSMSMSGPFACNIDQERKEQDIQADEASDTLFVGIGKRGGEFGRKARKENEEGNADMVKHKVREDIIRVIRSTVGGSIPFEWIPHTHKEHRRFEKGTGTLIFQSESDATRAKAALELDSARVYGLTVGTVSYAASRPKHRGGKSGKRGNGGKGGKHGKGGGGGVGSGTGRITDDRMTRLGAVQALFSLWSDLAENLDCHNVVGLVFFGDTIHYACQLTELYESFKDEVVLWDVSMLERKTRLLDAINFSAERLDEFKQGHDFDHLRLRVVCLTDGDDVGSSCTRASTESTCQKLGVTVDAIVIGNDAGFDALRRVADATGGACVRPADMRVAVPLFTSESMLSMRGRGGQFAGNGAPVRRPTFAPGTMLMNASQAMEREIATARARDESEDRNGGGLRTPRGARDGGGAQDDRPMATARIMAELKACHKNDVAGVRGPYVGDDMSVWMIFVDASEDCMGYKGGTWKVSITFTSDFPFKAPKARFETKIMHVNVNGDGLVCHSILAQDWAQSTDMRAVLGCLRRLLEVPNFDDPIDHMLAQRHRDDTEAYWQEVQACTTRYALHVAADGSGGSGDGGSLVGSGRHRGQRSKEKQGPGGRRKGKGKGGTFSMNGPMLAPGTAREEKRVEILLCQITNILPVRPVRTPHDTVVDLGALYEHLRLQGEKVSGDNGNCVCGCGESDRSNVRCLCTISDCTCSVYKGFDPAPLVAHLSWFLSTEVEQDARLEESIKNLREYRESLGDRAITSAAASDFDRRRSTDGGAGGVTKGAAGGDSGESDDETESLLSLALVQAAPPSDGLAYGPLIDPADQSSHCVQCGAQNALFSCGWRCDQVRYCTIKCRDDHQETHSQFCERRNDWNCLREGCEYRNHEYHPMCAKCGTPNFGLAPKWACGVCTLDNLGIHLSCFGCGKAKDYMLSTETWACPSCTYANSVDLSCCTVCNRERDLKG
jgi:ubiquitin-protein ligase